MPWVKGQSGNPTGRKPGPTRHIKRQEFVQALRDLEPTMLVEIEKKVRSGNMQAIQLAAEYGWGKPVQQNLNLNVNYDFTTWTEVQVQHFIETGQVPHDGGELL